jgi:CTP synthase (UTP-ammonia lyase)
MASSVHKPIRLVALGDRDERHVTHREIDAALGLLPPWVDGRWLATDDPAAARDLDGAAAVWLVSGGPYRDDSAVLAAIDRCLDARIPFLGTCSGFQYACLGLARRAGFAAAHAEAEPDADDPLIAPLPCRLDGVLTTVTPVPGTRLASICGEAPFDGFHLCGFGLDCSGEQLLESAGAVIAARGPDVGVEAIEVSSHPFFIATAFQPQIGSSDSGEVAPLIRALLTATTG